MIPVIKEVYLSPLGMGGARNSREPWDGLRTLLQAGLIWEGELPHSKSSEQLRDDITLRG